VRAGHTSVAFTLDRYGHLFEGHDAELRDRLDAMHAAGLERAGGGAVVELPRRPRRGPARPQRGPRRSKQHPGAVVVGVLSWGDGGCAARTRTPNRCLKSAKQPDSRPAAQRRKQPSTRILACRYYPLLTRGC